MPEQLRLQALSAQSTQWPVFQAWDPASLMNSKRHKDRISMKEARRKSSRFPTGTGTTAPAVAGGVGDGFAVVTGDMVAVASGAIADAVLRSSCDSN
ncbi:hypothetical protein ASD99_24520 [Mesorhizobium sp. Root695]|nr:hypothetical protein ASD99_24520 [Mesorhizobium sp. Root695]